MEEMKILKGLIKMELEEVFRDNNWDTSEIDNNVKQILKDILNNKNIKIDLNKSIAKWEKSYQQ